MPCETIDRRIADYLDERMSDEQRDELRAHLAGCAGCRDKALALEPTLAFSLLKSTQASEFEIERNVMAVRTLVRQERMRQELRPERSTRSLRPAYLAAAAALTMMVSAAIWLRDANHPVAVAEQESQQAVAASIVATEEREAPRVEVAMDAKVRVYQMSTDSNEAFVVILNPALEL